MTVPYQILREDGNKASVAVTVEGRVYTADQDHPKFQEILNGLVVTPLTETQLRDLFDISMSIGAKFEAIPGFDRLSVNNGRIYFDHKEAHGVLTDEILRHYTEGLDFQYLVNFAEKISSNPNPHSIEHAYAWLKQNNFTILPDGDIIAYKGVGNDFLSLTSGTAIVDGIVVKGRIPNLPGSVIQMPRSEVVFDPSGACLVGLHVATYAFARSFASRVVMVKVNPRDIVSVPSLTSADKMRVCQYIVGRKTDSQFQGPLWEDDQTFLSEADPELERLLAEEEEIERATRAHHQHDEPFEVDDESEPLVIDPARPIEGIRNLLARFKSRRGQ